MRKKKAELYHFERTRGNWKDENPWRATLTDVNHLFYHTVLSAKTGCSCVN